MKKLLCITLALIIGLGCLAGCSNSSSAPAATQAPAETQAPADTQAAAPAADGPDRSERIKIGFTVSNFDNENFVYMMDLIGKYCEENNMDFVTQQHNSESSALMEILENFQAAQCDGVILQNFEPESCQATLEELEEAGVKVISYDAEVPNVTGCWICSNYATGEVIGQAASDFINSELGGKCEYIVMDSKVVFMQERVKGIMDTIAKNCPESTMVATQRIVLSEAVDTFESMLTAYPNVQVLCTGYSTCATNIIAAWLPELARQGADLNKYGVFTCDCTNLDLQYMAETRAGKNILRSTIDLGLKDFVPNGMIQQVEAAIRGFDCEYAPGTVQTFPYDLVNMDNLDETAAHYNVDITVS